MIGAWDLLFSPEPPAQERLAALLLDYARPRRWFRAKSRATRGARVADVIPLPGDAPPNLLVLLEIAYDGDGAGADADLYVIPLAQVGPAAAAALAIDRPHALVALFDEGAGGALVDGLATGAAAPALLRLVRAGAVARGEHGELRGQAFPGLAEASAPIDGAALTVSVPRVEQTNSTVTFGDRLLLKIYRPLTPGASPELEMGEFLSARGPLAFVPRVLGALTYVGRDGLPRVLGVAHEYLSNDGDGWSLALRALDDYFDRVAREPAPPPPPGSQAATALVGRIASLAETLGRRTGQLHLALAATAGDPAFAPEPLTEADRAAMAARAESMLERHLAMLATAATVAPAVRALAERLRPDGPERRTIATLLARVRDRPIAVVKTRIHGDLHLGQVLARGDDFAIIDFEGEPARPPDERRAKSSPLRDVMGMVRSFDYAPAAALRARARAAAEARSSQAELEPWAALWTAEVSAAFLRGYLATVTGAPFLPRDADALSALLLFHELEKVIYELGYEIDNRPDWVEIPLRRLVEIGAGGRR